MGEHLSPPQAAQSQTLGAARLFDGHRFWQDAVVCVAQGRITDLRPRMPQERVDQEVAGLLVPAFVDLQVNGGGGVLLGGQTDAAGLARLCATHRALGSGGVLPTLITDTPEATRHVLGLGQAAARAKMPGFLGLHLEGPHLDPRRMGVHDGAKIRPMDEGDLAQLCAAAQQLPALMVTLAPEAVTNAQIRALAAAGVIVSLGHSDCSFAQAQAAFDAGARAVTHLFNAMSQLGHRSPGLVGAALAGSAALGLIADGHHVHPAAMDLALRARGEGVFLVSDCMHFAGTDLTEMTLHGRRVIRAGGRLALEDGTLAGADLTMAQALAYLIQTLGTAPERALAMAGRIPAAVIGCTPERGLIRKGALAEFAVLTPDYRLQDTLYL